MLCVVSETLAVQALGQIEAIEHTTDVRELEAIVALEELAEEHWKVAARSLLEQLRTGDSHSD